MKNSAMLTTTISPNLLSWVDKYSKQQKITKRMVIEEALKKYRFDLRKRELAKSFGLAAKDMEIISMAEEGLEDYNNQLKSFDL